MKTLLTLVLAALTGTALCVQEHLDVPGVALALLGLALWMLVMKQSFSGKRRK